MRVQRTGKKQRQSKGKKTVRQKNLVNRLNAYAKLVGFEEKVSSHALLPKRFGGFTRPGSGKRT